MLIGQKNAHSVSVTFTPSTGTELHTVMRYGGCGLIPALDKETV